MRQKIPVYFTTTNDVKKVNTLCDKTVQYVKYFVCILIENAGIMYHLLQVIFFNFSIDL